MDFLSPRIAPGIGVAMARVATRFYFFSILLVASTIYLPHKGTPGPYNILVLAAIAAGMMIVLSTFPWDKHEPRVFTLTYLFSSSLLLAALVYFTGGAQSGYGLLYFLIVLFSFFYNLVEMFIMTSVVSLFYLAPHLYDTPDPYHLSISVVTVLFFYLGTYILYGITRYVIRKNRVLEELNRDLMELYSMTSGLMSDLEKGALPDALAESLKKRIPSTYCIVMLLDEDRNLTSKIACPIRPLTWGPVIGSTYAADRLRSVRTALETRQPVLYQLEADTIDDDLKKILTPETASVLVVPLGAGEENLGVMIFGDERQRSRSPFSSENIQRAVAISGQTASAVAMGRCLERLTVARREIQISHDKIIKAERLATLGEVTRAVEHEINNPLSVIVNWSEIYRNDQTIDPGLRSKFQIIYEMSERITAVIKKLSEMRETRSVEFIKGQKMTHID
jgi:GAF domain-containing protein